MHINIWEALSILQRRQMTTTASQLVARSKGGREMKGKMDAKQTAFIRSWYIDFPLILISIKYNV